MFVLPPTDGAISEEDSGDEMSGEANNLSSKQLQAEGTATVHTVSGKFELGSSSTDESGSDDEEMIDISGSARSVSNAELAHQPAFKKDFKWCNKPFVSSDCDPSTKNKTFTCEKQPSNFFELFFDDEICLFLAEMTSLYASSHGEHNLDMTVSDVRCFVGILLLSGYVGVPRWRMFWEVGTETYNSCVANAMTRNKFEQIKRFLHCSDNDNLCDNDKFAKVRPLINMLNERFLAYAPEESHLCIDESIVPYYGRHGAKQFLKGKPTRPATRRPAGRYAPGRNPRRSPVAGRLSTRRSFYPVSRQYLYRVTTARLPIPSVLPAGLRRLPASRRDGRLHGPAPRCCRYRRPAALRRTAPVRCRHSG